MGAGTLPGCMEGGHHSTAPIDKKGARPYREDTVRTIPTQFGGENSRRDKPVVAVRP